MDFLAHIFLPLIVVYALRRDVFSSQWTYLLAGFGLLSDFDKYLGVPGLLHSVLTLVPLCVAILAVERWWRGRLELAPVIVFFILSHVALDLIDGGPATLFTPLVDTGFGLEFPMRVTFGEGILGITVSGPPVAIRTAVPRGGFNQYGFINSTGVASMLAFLLIYAGDALRPADRAHVGQQGTDGTSGDSSDGRTGVE